MGRIDAVVQDFTCLVPSHVVSARTVADAGTMPAHRVAQHFQPAYYAFQAESRPVTE